MVYMPRSIDYFPGRVGSGVVKKLRLSQYWVRGGGGDRLASVTSSRARVLGCRNPKSGSAAVDREGDSLDDESDRAKFMREALTLLSKFVVSRLPAGTSILDELMKLMSCLNLSGRLGLEPNDIDFSEFSCFYDFVFFIFREKGQKISKNHRYNISEDTWQQVLAFSHCVHESLEGYDPEVLIDDFVEHMYRISGVSDNTNFCCACDDAEDMMYLFPNLPGLKRKFRYDCVMVGEELSDMHIQDSLESNWSPYTKRRIYSASSSVCDGYVTKHSSTLGSRSPCVIEGCFSMGLSVMFAGHHHLPIERVRRVSSYL